MPRSTAARQPGMLSLHPLCLLFVLALCLTQARAQETTYTDDQSGLTLVGSVTTDAAGSPTTRVLSTASAPTATATSATTTATASDTTSYTIYTENSSLVTWYASTPTTPVPSWSTGSIEAAAAYFSTLSAEASSSGIGNSATPARVSYSAGWALAVAVIGGFGAGGVAGY
ncbi:hypothetical protein DMC30DRAFT_398701 [Rhodotorula diobovata]|uniref:Proteophosphoglycan ppg4 n=1 Tax=Rhodotorula diobovata TaxID=5288 RepID=A0A5C5FUT4_9BASI|nr:hypothetical protein DMC30DRAFT_398701 [Rhodotorula diobovata]